MRLLVSGCTTTVYRLMQERPDRLGVLTVPRDGNRLPAAPTVYAADNGCFSGLDAPRFLKLLGRLVAHKHKPLWVTAPDVVGNAMATMNQYRVWSPVIRAVGLPVALVLQDGHEDIDLRKVYPELTAVFVGGSTMWKLSTEAMRITQEAHDAGLLVHYGRVNTARRIRLISQCHRSGLAWCDTIDGGSASKWGETNIPKLIRWMDKAEADDQRILF